MECAKRSRSSHRLHRPQRPSSLPLFQSIYFNRSIETQLFLFLLIHFFLLACLWSKSARLNHLLMWGSPNFGACNLSHMLGLITNGSMGGTPEIFHSRVVLIVWWGLLIIHGWLVLHNFIRWLGLNTWWELNLGSAWWLPYCDGATGLTSYVAELWIPLLP